MTPPPDETNTGEATGGTLPGALPSTTDICARHIVCPHCGTANRLTRQTCVHCERDLSMLRTIANKARHHFNTALEHAERRRWDEAIVELRNCLDLDANFVDAWNVLGTCLAKLERFDESRGAWQHAIEIDSRFAKAHDYLQRVEHIGEAKRHYRRLRLVSTLLFVALLGAMALVWMQWRPDPALEHLARANSLYAQGDRGSALDELDAAIEGKTEPTTFQAAQALRNAIDSEFDQALMRIDDARDAGQWEEGLEACERMLAMEPPPTLARLATARQGEFAGRLAERALVMTADVIAGDRDANGALAALTAMRDRMPTEVMRSEITAHIASVEEIRVAQRAAEFSSLAAEAISAVPDRDTPAQLRIALTLLPEWNDVPEAESIVAALSSQEAGNVQSEWVELVAGEDPDALTAWSDELRALQISAEISAAASANLESLSIAIASAESVIPTLTLQRLLAATSDLDDYERASALLGLASEWSDHSECVEALASSLQTLVEVASSEFTDLNEPGSSVAMSSLVDRLEAVTNSTTDPQILSEGVQSDLTRLTALLADARRAARDLQVEEVLAEATDLLNREDWEGALDTISELLVRSDISQDQALRVDEIYQIAQPEFEAAQARAALALFERWLDQDRAFETLSISVEEAQEAVDRWEWVVETIPSNYYSRNFTLDYSLFYAARAHEKLGNPTDAAALYRHLLDEFQGGDHRQAAQDSLARLESANSQAD